MEIAIYKSAATALLISVFCTPIVIFISRKKGFYASIDHRSSHDTRVPNTGGIILFFSVLIPLIVYSDYPNLENFSLLISAFAVLLITGIIDDFNPIPVAYKFLGQFIPAIVIVTSIDVKDLMIPFLNDYIQLPYFFNYFFWILFVVMAINAFNLIDGIDGLAIGLGILGGLFYFQTFLQNGELRLSIFSIVLSAGLFGLLFYNFSNSYKIFLGDTGSLLIGGLLIFFALNFISSSDNLSVNNSFFMLIGSLFIPMFDMIRLTLMRTIKGSSPFKADREHIHHIVLDLLRGNHLLTTVVLLTCQFLIIYLFSFLSNLPDLALILSLTGSFAFYFVLSEILNRWRKPIKA